MPRIIVETKEEALLYDVKRLCSIYGVEQVAQVACDLYLAQFDLESEELVPVVGKHDAFNRAGDDGEHF